MLSLEFSNLFLLCFQSLPLGLQLVLKKLGIAF